jgi:hypothetical protein
MAKKSDKDKLIEIAAKVLNMPAKNLADALDETLDRSVLKRDNMLLADMYNKLKDDYEKLQSQKNGKV